jgi:hypothetical protein
MDFQPGTSNLYGSLLFFGGSDVRLATINTSTGVVSVIGQTAPRIDAITWAVEISDACIKDVNTGNNLRLNPVTGEYVFTECGSKGLMLGGRGKINRNACVIELFDTRPDRLGRATFDSCGHNGSAAIQVFNKGRSFSINDSETLKEVRACP